MSDAQDFRELLGRLRDGEPQAAEELVRRYEPVIRIALRSRLNDPYLRQASDSICQSVLASFVLRAAAGQFRLDSPDALHRLLLRMARNKLASRVRTERARGQDGRRLADGHTALASLPAGPSPDQIVMWRELLAKFREILGEEGRQLADLRAAGYTWPEIAAAVGRKDQACRRQLERAVRRALEFLNLDEAFDA